MYMLNVLFWVVERIVNITFHLKDEAQCIKCRYTLKKISGVYGRIIVVELGIRKSYNTFGYVALYFQLT